MLLLFITVVAPPVRGEGRLIKRAKGGDVGAFEALLAANGPATPAAAKSTSKRWRAGPRPAAPTSRAPATPAWTSRTRSPACPPTCGPWC